MKLGFDATYTLDPEPTGVAVYSREMLSGIARINPSEDISAYYRLHRFRRSLNESLPKNVHRRVLVDSFAPRTDIFHGLNQRLPRKKKGRFIATFHDLFVMSGEYSTQEFRERFTLLAKEAAERADLIIAVSQFTANQVRDLLGVEETRIRVVHHGIHPISSASSPERIILHTGAIQKRKNLHRLVQAFEATQPGWKLILAGGAGYGSEEILEYIHESPRQEDIEVTGYVSEEQLNQLYQRAGIFAFPSLDEGFGIPILEAMRQGVPVITSNRSATAEVAGDAALLVDPLNMQEITEALQQLMDSGERRHHFRMLGMERFKNFSWEKAVRQTNEIYRELL